MKKLLIIILWLVSISLNATNYYVKTGGNDAAAGTSDGTAWATISKVNTVWAAGTFAPGDNIYFRRGDSFTGTIAVTESGSAGSVITVGAYGTGADPIINGFATVSSWVSEGGGIYSKAVTCASDAIMLTVDGVNTAMGRTPNAGSAWWMSQSDNGGPGFSSTLTDAVHLNSGTLNWTGAEVVIKVNLYTISHLNITSHSGSTIGFTETAAGDIVNGYGYFIQNDIRTLDVFGEWFYDGSEVFMYFGAADPADYVVKIASVDYGVTITGYSYVTFDNLDFEGFNYSAFSLGTCPHITIQNCTFNFMGYNAVDGYTSAGSANTATGLVFTGNTVSDVGSNGVHTDEPFTTMTISNNTFNNLGVIAGQGYKRWIDTHSAVVFGARANDNINTVVEYNTITNAGYCGIYWYGDRATIRYNFINNFSTLLDDGGAIYTYDNVATTRTGTVTYNICLNGTGNTDGRPSSSTYSYGLYTDGSTVGIDMTHNTVAYVSHAGYLTNSNLNGSLEDNTFYSCQNGIWIAGTNSMNGMTILRNIMFARLSTQYTAMFNFSGSPLASTTLDYNIYTRPISETTTIYHPSSTTVTLATWKSTTGDDVHSSTAGRTVSSSVEDAQIHFRYNNTTSNQTYVPSATMYDPFGVGYTNPFVLAPFTSKILLGAGTVTLYSSIEPIVILTTSVTAGYNQATAGGNVIDEGSSSVTEKGVCWSTSANPTINDSHVADGSGLGSYSVLITGLTAATTYHARAYAINSGGVGYGDDVPFTTSGTYVPGVTTTAISAIAQTTASSGGNVTSQGTTAVTARGVCWSTITGPTTALTTKTSDGSGTGVFTSSLTGLTAGTHYYVRAYATNSIGTAYGSQQEFTTAAADNIPSVTTTAISDIMAVSATGGGNVTDDGGDAVTARGVCWNTSANPTTANFKTTNGTGEGIFTSSITGLSEGVTYYVRAYATNSVGTGYGGQVSFVATDGEEPPPADLGGDVVFINGLIWMNGNKVIIKTR